MLLQDRAVGLMALRICHLLDQATSGGAATNYKTVHNTPIPSSSDVCGKCHQAGSYWSGDAGSRFNEHNKHVNSEEAECYLCHDTHGSEQFHLMNFNRNGNTTNCITSIGTNSQAAFTHNAGTTANYCTITCHGTSMALVNIIPQLIPEKNQQEI